MSDDTPCFLSTEPQSLYSLTDFLPTDHLAIVSDAHTSAQTLKTFIKLKHPDLDWARILGVHKKNTFLIRFKERIKHSEKDWVELRNHQTQNLTAKHRTGPIHHPSPSIFSRRWQLERTLFSPLLSSSVLLIIHRPINYCHYLLFFSKPRPSNVLTNMCDTSFLLFVLALLLPLPNQMINENCEPNGTE